MTWSPRNRSEDDVSGDEDMDVKISESGSSPTNISGDDNHGKFCPFWCLPTPNM